ncbi:hypothetical protein SAMN02583745_01218 [Thorsellia anophelis DSM 18579]|uniref:Uncharacterized protein n=1 Tax=Thorsellia anophelis DSM 18579 TaxID=1123402 RepID=A0A1I0BAC8_9GAMM|nr:hypothetical protein SAMN02583745_01218 [Thorsellia anophelis DSM 18579]
MEKIDTIYKGKTDEVIQKDNSTPPISYLQRLAISTTSIISAYIRAVIKVANQNDFDLYSIY